MKRFLASLTAVALVTLFAVSILNAESMKIGGRWKFSGNITAEADAYPGIVLPGQVDGKVHIDTFTSDGWEIITGGSAWGTVRVTYQGYTYKEELRREDNTIILNEEDYFVYNPSEGFEIDFTNIYIEGRQIDNDHLTVTMEGWYEDETIGWIYGEGTFTATRDNDSSSGCSTGFASLALLLIPGLALTMRRR